MKNLALLAIMAQCSPDVPPQNLMSIVNVESGGNEYAVAVVPDKNNPNDNFHYQQPKNKDEAIELINTLESKKKNYSVGLMQINRANFDKYSITINNMFDACKNIETGGEIYKGCYVSIKNNPENKDKTEQELLRMAHSCYYSGNQKRGFVKENNNYSYVDKINKSIKGVNQVYAVPTIAQDSTIYNSNEKTEPINNTWDVFNDFKK